MIGRKALFPGRDYLHQLRLIIDVRSTPSNLLHLLFLPTMTLLTIALPTTATPTRCSARHQRRTSPPSLTHRLCSSYARCPSSPRGACVCVYVERDPPQGYAYFTTAMYFYYGHTYYGYTYYGRPWSEIFPSASEQCLDLLARMLVFNPAKRCSMEESYSL